MFGNKIMHPTDAVAKDDATNIFTNFHHDTVLLDLIHLYELEKEVLGRRGYANVLGVLLVRLITN